VIIQGRLCSQGALSSNSGLRVTILSVEDSAVVVTTLSTPADSVIASHRSAIELGLGSSWQAGEVQLKRCISKRQRMAGYALHGDCPYRSVPLKVAVSIGKEGCGRGPIRFSAD